MPITEWDPAYNLGIEQILKELMAYTHYHFAAEERIMKENRFSSYRSHVNRHNEFKKQLDALYAGYYSGEAFASTDVVLLLREWMINHILNTDKKIASHILQMC